MITALRSRSGEREVRRVSGGERRLILEARSRHSFVGRRCDSLRTTCKRIGCGEAFAQTAFSSAYASGFLGKRQPDPNFGQVPEVRAFFLAPPLTQIGASVDFVAEFAADDVGEVNHADVM